jgi:hypothetical protein
MVIHNGLNFAVIMPFCNKVFCMNKYILCSVAALSFLFSGITTEGQDSGYDVFNPISKYIATGDAEKLSAWFSDNLEVTIFANSNDSSRNQARQIMKSFFRSYTPRSFEITHRAGRSNKKYALGTLNAGGEMFVVTIFVNYTDTDYRIQHLKIERMN